MQIIVAADKSGWHVDDLRRAAIGRGHSLVNCPWRALTAAVGAAGAMTAAERAEVKSEGVVLDHADAVLVRAMPAGSLEQVVFRMDVLHRLVARGVTVINGPRAKVSAARIEIGRAHV